MADILDRVAALRRPRLLVRAARAASAGYDRRRDLATLLGAVGETRDAEALARLLAAEADLEEARRAGAAGWSPIRHVATLGALLAEFSGQRAAAAGETSDARRAA